MNVGRLSRMILWRNDFRLHSSRDSRMIESGTEIAMIIGLLIVSADVHLAAPTACATAERSALGILHFIVHIAAVASS